MFCIIFLVQFSSTLSITAFVLYTHAFRQFMKVISVGSRAKEHFSHARVYDAFIQQQQQQQKLATISFYTVLQLQVFHRV